MSTLRRKKCVIKGPSSIPQANIPLTMHLPLSPITQARHSDAAASVVFSESSFEASH